MHFCIVVGVAWAAIFSARTVLFNPDSVALGRDSYERYRDGKYFKVCMFSLISTKVALSYYVLFAVLQFQRPRAGLKSANL